MIRTARDVISFRLGSLKRKKRMQPIAPPRSKVEMMAEIKHLNAINAKVLETAQYVVYFSPSKHLPNIMLEIARLREIAFRAIGEGTQKNMDIDRYDAYYHQLFLWDKQQNTIAGGYRIGLGKNIYQQYGLSGFYVASMFVVEKPAHHILARGLELGRAFVCPEYQQKPLPLFLLWKGIREVAKIEEGHDYMFGCVSISNAFNKRSKSIMISFLRRYYFDNVLSQHIHPRKPFTLRGNLRALKREIDGIQNNIKALDKLIAQQQPDGLHVPILLKKYLKQNARLVAFNIDPTFNNCLDGLMYIAIKDLPEE